MPWQSKNHNILHPILVKVISLIIIITFTFSNGLSYGFPSQTLIGSKPHSQRYVKSETEENLLDIKDNPAAIAFPSVYGQIVESYQGEGDTLVVHIQDRHVDEVAQLNIAGILKGFAENYDIRLHCLEGASKRLDTSFYNSFPDGEIKEKVSRLFVKKALFTGAEYFKITNQGLNISAFGVEDKELYLAHLKAYQDSQPDKEKIISYLSRLAAQLNKIKTHIYSRPLKELEFKNREYQDKRITLAEYSLYLAAAAERLKVDFTAYPNFRDFFNLVKKEKEIDFKKAEEQRQKLIEELSQRLKKDKLKRLLKLSLDYRLGKISAVCFYEYLENLSPITYHLSPYKDLLSYIEYLKISGRINHLRLFDEIESVEEKIASGLSKSQVQMRVFQFSKSLTLLKDLYSLKLTHKKLNYIESDPAEFDIVRIAGFIKNTCRALGIPTLIDDSPYINSRQIKTAQKFYQLAAERDMAIVNNTLNRLPYSSNRAAALITGGFHTSGITNILKKKRISYVVICPNIGTETSEKLYADRMKGVLPDYADILQAASQTIVPALTTGDIAELQRTKDVTESVFGRAYIEEFFRTKSAEEQLELVRAKTDFYNEKDAMHIPFNESNGFYEALYRKLVEEDNEEMPEELKEGFYTGLCSDICFILQGFHHRRLAITEAQGRHKCYPEVNLILPNRRQSWVFLDIEDMGLEIEAALNPESSITLSRILMRHLGLLGGSGYNLFTIWSNIAKVSEDGITVYFKDREHKADFENKLLRLPASEHLGEYSLHYNLLIALQGRLKGWTVDEESKRIIRESLDGLDDDKKSALLEKIRKIATPEELQGLPDFDSPYLADEFLEALLSVEKPALAAAGLPSEDIKASSAGRAAKTAFLTTLTGTAVIGAIRLKELAQGEAPPQTAVTQVAPVVQTPRPAPAPIIDALQLQKKLQTLPHPLKMIVRETFVLEDESSADERFKNYEEEYERIPGIVNLIFGDKISEEQKRRWELLLLGTAAVECNFLDKYSGITGNGTSRYQIIGETADGIIHNYATYPIKIERKDGRVIYRTGERKEIISLFARATDGRVTWEKLMETERAQLKKLLAGIDIAKATNARFTQEKLMKMDYHQLKRTLAKGGVIAAATEGKITWNKFVIMYRGQLRELMAKDKDFACLMSTLVYKDTFGRKGIETMPADIKGLARLYLEVYNPLGAATKKGSARRFGLIHKPLSESLGILYAKTTAEYRQLYKFEVLQRKAEGESAVFVKIVNNDFSNRMALLLKRYGITPSNIYSNLTPYKALEGVEKIWYARLKEDEGVHIIIRQEENKVLTGLVVCRDISEWIAGREEAAAEIGIYGELYNGLINPLLKKKTKKSAQAEIRMPTRLMPAPMPEVLATAAVKPATSTWAATEDFYANNLVVDGMPLKQYLDMKSTSPPPYAAVLAKSSSAGDIRQMEAGCLEGINALFTDERMGLDNAFKLNNVPFGLIISASILHDEDIDMLNTLKSQKSLSGKDKFEIYIDATEEQMKELREKGLSEDIKFTAGIDGIPEAKEERLLYVADILSKRTICSGMIVDEDTGKGLKERAELLPKRVFVRAQKAEEKKAEYKGRVAVKVMLLGLLIIFHDFNPKRNYAAEYIIKIDLEPPSSKEFARFADEAIRAYQQILKQA